MTEVFALTYSGPSSTTSSSEDDPVSSKSRTIPAGIACTRFHRTQKQQPLKYFPAELVDLATAVFCGQNKKTWAKQLDKYSNPVMFLPNREPWESRENPITHPLNPTAHWVALVKSFCLKILTRKKWNVTLSEKGKVHVWINHGIQQSHRSFSQKWEQQ